MKYAVTISYNIKRTLIIHAANSKLAEEKAKRIVEGWQDAATPSILSTKEQ